MSSTPEVPSPPDGGFTPPEHHFIGLDGKRYPGSWLPQEDRDYLFGRVHYLRHDEELSVRQIRARIAAEHNVRRSVGWVAGILKEPCNECSGV